jgi:endoglucanase Acf2
MRLISMGIRTALLVAFLGGASFAGIDAASQLPRDFTAELPKGARGPQQEICQTENVKGKMPTNQWWSSLAWMKYSERQYPHPLTVQASSRGLRVYYPGPGIAFNRDGITGAMPADKGEDLLLGLSTTSEFPDARVDGFSDWFVRARFGDLQRNLTVSYGHGSPFIYATYRGGMPKLTFSEPPKVWAGDEHSPVLGVTIHRKPYALFGPTGSTWNGIGTQELVNQSNGKPYFSLAVLPAGDDATLALFKRYAYSHVTNTRATWHYDPKTSAVSCDFVFTTQRFEGDSDGTLFALYPHQWRNTSAKLLGPAYASVRGTMKLAEGSSFTTNLIYAGVLPALPKAGAEPAKIEAYLKEELTSNDTGIRNTYGDGKHLGRLADQIPIAEQFGLSDVANTLRHRIQDRLQGWFSTGNPVKNKMLFYYDARWGTLIGYPAGYGSDNELNDHHFHYGYFIRAAAELARHDYKSLPREIDSMTRMLVRDIANPDHADALFPFMRNFDSYAGHSWASGHARFGDGNNEESSSEAINAWYGLILWGTATHDDALRDLGIWLYTTETTSAREYWLDVQPSDFEFASGATPPPWLAMMWGGKGANGTWFSAKYEPRHAINWLPIHGGSLYLGFDPAGAKRNYDALVVEKHGAQWEQWADLIWMYRALSDPDDAMNQYEQDSGRTKPEAGNSPANLCHWLTSLQQLGQVDATITADQPLYAVFRKGNVRTYAAYNSSDSPVTIHFSDGYQLQSAGNGFAVGH